MTKLGFRRRHRSWHLGFALVLGVSPLAAAFEEGFPPWQGREEKIEEALTYGEVVSLEELGRGVTNPEKAALEHNGLSLEAVWKPLREGYSRGYWESYKSEVAAYRLDRFLGLGMVPPTVERKIGAFRGSLQMWVDGCRLFEEVRDHLPKSDAWHRQLSRMKFFDSLLYNRDRNAGNFMVDDQWRVVLIDHSRSILFRKQLDTRPERIPRFFDRQLVERLKALDRAALEELLGDLLPKRHINGLLFRRDALLAHVEAQLAARGQSVFF